MKKITIKDIIPLEEYAKTRGDFRKKVMAHKSKRRLCLGENVVLYFEDYTTMYYQVHEVLRVEKVSDKQAIQEELDAYNPLIPEGSDWRATMMIEYEDPTQRYEALARFVGIENKIWMRVGDQEKIYAIANEDLDRSTEDKTSAVHFLRFPLPQNQVTMVLNDEPICAGVSHKEYTVTMECVGGIRESLSNDLGKDS